MGRRVRGRAAGKKVSFVHDGLSKATTNAATTAAAAALSYHPLEETGTTVRASYTI